MIPQKPEILKAPLVADGEKNILPETTPQGSNQFSLLGGFPAITSIPINAGGLPPKRLDFNAAFNLLSIHTFFLQSGNKYAWDALLDYSIGSTVLGSNNSVYFCIKANGATPPNTVQNPVSSSGYWIELINSNGTINIDLIADKTITTNKLADGAVTSAKIADGTITAADIANNAVTNAKIANSAVNDAKISGVAASKVSGLATVAKTGNYNDLTNKPNIPTNAAPLPTNQQNILGSFIYLTDNDSNTLPAGGSWAWWSLFNISNNISLFKGGISAGGTILSATARVVAWRIQ